MNIPEIIYHYTSYESFYNILSTGNLHLGNPWNTNDPLEGEYSKHQAFTTGKNKDILLLFPESLIQG